MCDLIFEDFLEKLVGSKLGNVSLYYKAFVHPSFNGTENYQRLEFLGDAVVSLAISHLLFFKDEKMYEGELTKNRMGLVRKEVLSKISYILGFKDFILLGRGEEKDNGREKESILADVFEAFIGAMYLDKGFDFVFSWIQERIDLFYKAGIEIKDYKSMLQELAQSKGLGMPKYIISKEDGEAHKKIFFVDLHIDGKLISSASGKSKKSAEQQAAQSGFYKLLNEKA